MSVEGGEPVETRVFVVGPDVRFGVVSDVDDTVMVTALPRPLLAAWNSFVVDEHARQPVPGMAVLMERLVRDAPGRAGDLPLDRRLERRADADPVPAPPPVPARRDAAHRLGSDPRPLVPQRQGAQALEPAAAGRGVPARQVAAHRRRRPARRRDLHRPSRASIPTTSRRRDPPPVPRRGGARRWPHRRRRPLRGRRAVGHASPTAPGSLERLEEVGVLER